jgi:hypothetical protein
MSHKLVHQTFEYEPSHAEIRGSIRAEEGWLFFQDLNRSV